MKKIIPALVLYFFLSLRANVCFAQQEIELYADSIPNSIHQPDSEYKDNYNAVFLVSHPKLYVFKPAAGAANGTAVIICPGGGYYGIIMQHEGSTIAEYFAKLGITAFVLKYRIPNDRYIRDKSLAPLQDAQQAIKWIREHAAAYKLDTGRIGVMGFSAGGHLAASLSVHFQQSFIANTEHINLRPDFTMLVYPVISMTDKIGHIGSRDNLLGKNPSAKKIEFFSNELQVTALTPPCLLIHTSFDRVVPVSNSIAYYEALQRYHIPVEMHLLQEGDHGFIITTPMEEWINYCTHWLKINKFLAPRNLGE